MQPISLLVPLLTLVALTSTTPASSQTVVCITQPAPPGHVSVQVTTDPRCGAGRSNNAHVVIKPGKVQAACFGSLPPGYVLVKLYLESTCFQGNPNAMVIKIPGITELVCNGSPIPPGYQIVSSSLTPDCGSGSNNTLLIRKH
jgi:hypothetical protein